MMHIYMMSTLRAIAISAWMGDIYLHGPPQVFVRLAGDYLVEASRWVAASRFWFGDWPGGRPVAKYERMDLIPCMAFLLALFMLILIVLSCMASQFCIVHLGL